MVVLINIQKVEIALAGVAQWIEHRPANQRSPVDSQSGHMPGLWATFPLGGCEAQLFLSVSFPSPLSKNKYYNLKKK